jgi:hypothetical protein
VRSLIYATLVCGVILSISTGASAESSVRTTTIPTSSVSHDSASGFRYEGSVKSMSLAKCLTAGAATIVVTLASSASPTFADQANQPSKTVAPIQVVDEIRFPLNDRVRHVVCVSFLNTSQTLITAVRFDFIATNTFHEVVAHVHGDRMGEFSPGVTIDGPKNVDEYNTAIRGGTLGGANQKIRNCFRYFPTGGVPVVVNARATHVIFADGSEWIEPPNTQGIPPNPLDTPNPLDAQSYSKPPNP